MITDAEQQTIKAFFQKVFNNKVIFDEINRIESKGYFKKILDCISDNQKIKELKKGLNKPFLVLDSCGLIKIKYKSSTESNLLLGTQDTILLSYKNFDSWYETNYNDINSFLALHETSDKKIYELISIYFINNINSLLTS
jgi:hypothetical protein